MTISNSFSLNTPLSLQLFSLILPFVTTFFFNTSFATANLQQNIFNMPFTARLLDFAP